MMKCKMCPGHMIAGILVIVGALNWGLVGFFNYNLVSALFGSVPMLEKLVYILVGLAGVLMLFMCKCKKCCGEGSCCSKDGDKSCCGGEKKM